MNCATCGALAAGTFNDGSPRFSCGPHPPIYGDGPSPWEGLSIVLDAADQKWAAKVAHTVSTRYSAGRTATMKYLPPGRTIEDVNRQGFGAELAVARWSGLEWQRGHRRKPDVGDDVEVRCVRRADGMLALYSYDKPARRYVFVVGSFPSYRLVGWFTGREAMTERYWHPKGAVVMGYTLDVARFLVPALDLHPMTEFARDVPEAPAQAEAITA